LHLRRQKVPQNDPQEALARDDVGLVNSDQFHELERLGDELVTLARDHTLADHLRGSAWRTVQRIAGVRRDDPTPLLLEQARQLVDEIRQWLRDHRVMILTVD
jgi:hypothetical protein